MVSLKALSATTTKVDKCSVLKNFFQTILEGGETGHMQASTNSEQVTYSACNWKKWLKAEWRNGKRRGHFSVSRATGRQSNAISC